MELISREEAMRLLKEDLNASRSRGDDERADACFLHYIEISNLPTVEERNEGEWIKRDKWLYCSACDGGGWGLGAVTYEWQYCPLCGAKIGE